jgi:hypothetical protein
MLYDILQFFIGSIIMVFILWVLIKIHLHFSKDNITIIPS